MNDWDLWNAYCEAIQTVARLTTECEQRGLFRKPFTEWSRQAPQQVQGVEHGRSAEAPDTP